VRFLYLDFCGMVKAARSRGGLSPARQAAYLPVILSKELGGYDIYHGHVYTSGIAAGILARKYGGAAVNTIHGSYYPEWHSIANPAAAAFYRAGTEMGSKKREDQGHIQRGGYPEVRS
jgi:hypothetical protein